MHKTSRFSTIGSRECITDRPHSILEVPRLFLVPECIQALPCIGKVPKCIRGCHHAAGSSVVVPPPTVSLSAENIWQGREFQEIGSAAKKDVLSLRNNRVVGDWLHFHVK